MANMVGVQPVLVSLFRVESHYIRQGLQSMNVKIDYKDEIDLDKLDQDKLRKAIKVFKPDYKG